MGYDATERKLGRLFADARKADAEQAPSLAEIAGGRRVRPRIEVRWLRVSSAVAAVVLLVVWVSLSARKTPMQRVDAIPVAAASAVELKQWAALSNWTASTDTLLTLSSVSLGSSVATPTDSWISAGCSESGRTSTNGKENL
jgi:cytoskeletal protein RodZ